MLFLTIPLLASLLASPKAHAQSAEAEVLFREGRKLVKAGKLEAGCDKIEASEKLESSVGTLLNLGDCREKLGRYASAWAAFRKAESQAKVRGGDEKRRNEAGKRASVLEPKLSQLVIMVNGKTDGLVIKRDDEPIDAPMWNTPLPVDPDKYVIVAEAPGYKPWRTEINVTGKQRRQVVSVPALEKAPVASQPREQLGPTSLQPVVVQPPPTQPTYVVEKRSAPSMWTTSRKVAVGVGVVGAAALGTGIYFGLRSKDYEDKSNELCPGSICDVPEGLRFNDKAQTAAMNANILYVAGGAAIAAGAVIWLVGGPDKEVRVMPNVSASGAGVSLGGKF
ncbi:MAG: hypothetical protein M4D80_10780 [Myxococcota bacterium]|nr:hypothetical protein [Deltaproteobacteria bacterium]MDQ3335641.1 hypothetical protein [Myxococcota bacterium]